MPATGYSQRQVTAIPGTPFGVATITVPIGGGDATDLFSANSFAIKEAGGRAFYPAFSNTLLRGLVDAPQAFEIRPQPQPARVFNRELTQWWRSYNTAARQLATENDFPPLVYTYLTSMLGNRLGLQPPLLSRLQENKQPTELRQTLELLAGAENVRAGLMREAMQGLGPGSAPANLPIPGDVFWTPEVLPAIGDIPNVEPIAIHVPEECFYIRFGSFENYLWLSKLTREHGGDIGRMVTLRGHDA
ncbi:MAG: hypothetical protein HYV60_06505, partial [Planctomycetia bacterium]|nr:hypothetical protein [Planctomycetia bacterium]